MRIIIDLDKSTCNTGPEVTCNRFSILFGHLATMRKLLFLLTLVLQYSPTFSQGKNDTTVYTTVEQMPVFRSGQAEFGKYMARNLRLTREDQLSLDGKLRLSFVVEKDGSIDQVQVNNTMSKNFKGHVIGVLQRMPCWNPGVHNGVPVRCRMTLPINIHFKE
jgi:hypothetical protein